MARELGTSDLNMAVFLGRIGQFNRMSGQLSNYLAAPCTDHPRAGIEPPRSFGAGQAIDIDAS